VETYTSIKKLVENPNYPLQKQKMLMKLKDGMVDVPLADLISRINRLPYCFTLQSCFGHFLYDGKTDIHNLDPLPTKRIIGNVEYRIAYIAFCVENSPLGKKMLEAFEDITTLDPENIQFCCADWFWKKQLNSYVLQVEPDRFKRKDTAILDYREALHVEKVRNAFFHRLNKWIENAETGEAG